MERLKQQIGRAPTTREIADVMGMSEEKVTEIMSSDVSVNSIYDKKLNCNYVQRRHYLFVIVDNCKKRK